MRSGMDDSPRLSDEVRFFDFYYLFFIAMFYNFTKHVDEFYDYLSVFLLVRPIAASQRSGFIRRFKNTIPDVFEKTEKISEIG